MTYEGGGSGPSIIGYREFVRVKKKHARRRQSMIVSACLALPWIVTVKVWPVGPGNVGLVVGTAFLATIGLIAVIIFGGRFERAEEARAEDSYTRYLSGLPLAVLRTAASARDLDMHTRMYVERTLESQQHTVLHHENSREL